MVKWLCAGSAQLKKDCDAKWDANKAKTGAHGWHDYFQFMSKCYVSRASFGIILTHRDAQVQRHPAANVSARLEPYHHFQQA